MRMDTQQELEVKSKVKIFLNEKDVEGEYEVLSFLTYTPISLPIILSVEKQITKKFYEKAAIKAHELGGNGIIITGGGHCKIINIVDWVADDVAPAEFVNVIFDRTLMDKFLDGTVAKIEKRSERKREESAFKLEIESNIDFAKELDEVAFIREKISVLERYNTLLPKPSSSIEKTVEDLSKDLNKVERRIKLRIKWQEKKAARAASKAGKEAVAETEPEVVPEVVPAQTEPSSEPEEVTVQEVVSEVAPVSVDPSSYLDLCRSGEIKNLPKKEQKAILSELVKVLDERYKIVVTIDELYAISSDVLAVKIHYDLMSNGTKDDIDNLYAAVQKKMRQLSKQ